MPKKPVDIFESFLVGMERHWWSVYMDDKTTYINTGRFSKIQKSIQNYLLDIVRVIFLRACFEHIPRLSQQWPQSLVFHLHEVYMYKKK